jgi:hypothetical protein
VAGAKIALGNATAASATTSINLGSGASGTSSTGDLILRVPAGRLAHLVANDTPTFAPASNDLIITKGVMDTAITTATNGFMTSSGAVRSTTGDQTLGTTLGSFIVSTAGVAKLTIVSGGAATLANGLTVTTGGVLISNGGLTVTGACTLQTGLTVNSSAVTAATAPSNGSHLTNKDYVDAQIVTAKPKCQLHWSYASSTLTTLKNVGCSVVRTSLGVYTVTFSPAIAVPYVVSISFNYDPTPAYTGTACPVAQYTDISTSGFIIRTGAFGSGGSARDFANVSVIVY